MHPNTWAVRIGQNVHYAKSLREVGEWRKENRISDYDDVWVPTLGRWKKVSEIDLRSFGDQADEFLTAGCGWLLLGSLILWLGYSCFVAPFTRDDTGRNAKQLAELESQATAAFGDPEMRIEARGAQNVRIYIGKKAFEDIPFPDRQAAVEALGQRWCASVGGSFLPSMYIHDIRTGNELAHYDCTWYNLQDRLRRSTR